MRTHTEILKARRSTLASRFPDTALVFFSGHACVRNVPDVRSAFRQNSHSLFYFGSLPEAAVAVLINDHSFICLQQADPYDEVWHGPATAQNVVLEQSGVDSLCSRAELSEKLAHCAAIYSHEVFTLDTWRQQQNLLGGFSIEFHEDFLEAIVEQRLIHDSFAQGELRRAASATVDTLHQALQWMLEGGAESQQHAPSEKNLATRIAYLAGLQDASLAFPTIVTQNPAVLHAQASDASIGSAALLLCDLGLEMNTGYCSDYTRVFPLCAHSAFRSQFSDAQRALARELFEMLARVQGRCIEAITPGVRFLEIQMLAEREILRGLLDIGVLRGSLDELFADGVASSFFPHGVGHPIGLDVHDMQDLGDAVAYPKGRERSKEFGRCFLRFDRDVQEGMALTVEPGCYFAPMLLDALQARRSDLCTPELLTLCLGLGGVRREDTVLVTGTGCEVLTVSSTSEAPQFEW